MAREGEGMADIMRCFMDGRHVCETDATNNEYAEKTRAQQRQSTG